MYVIKRTGQSGGYVAKQGRTNSYTNALQHARVYATQEEAEIDRCPENEIVLSVSSIMGQ